MLSAPFPNAYLLLLKLCLIYTVSKTECEGFLQIRLNIIILSLYFYYKGVHIFIFKICN